MYTLELDIGSWTNPVIGNGYIESNPLADDVKIIKERDSNYHRLVRYKLTGAFIFINDEFRALKSLKDSNNKGIEAKIKYNGSERLTGYLSLGGLFDENKNECNLMFNNLDDYSELLKNKADTINLKTIFPSYTINRIQTLKTLYLTLPCFNGTEEEVKSAYLPIPPTGTEIPPPYEPPVADWDEWRLVSTTPCDTGFIYSFEVNYIEEYAPGFTQSTLLDDVWFEDKLHPVPARNPLNYWYDVFDIIDDLIVSADPSISISRSTYCDYFTEDLELQYLFVANKSDIKRNDASNPALQERISFEGWVDIMKNMFNLDWIIDNGVFKFVRTNDLSLPSFSSYPYHDFTNLINRNFTENQQRYGYNQELNISKEVWNFEVGEWLYYSELDYNTPYYENVKEYNIETVNNDIAYLLQDPDQASDAGLVFAACEYDSTNYDIISKTRPAAFGLTAIYENGKLMPSNLVYDHFKINRPFATAEQDKGFDVDLELTQRRDVEFSNLPIYDIDSIDFDYLVKSSVGDLKPHYFQVYFNGNKFSNFKGAF